jgi:hypothetical protein
MKNAATDGKRNILVRCGQSAAGVTLTTQAILYVEKILSVTNFT